MASLIYNNAKTLLLQGELDFDVDTVYAMLVTDSYTPNPDTHVNRDDVTNEVASGNGYTTGGKEVTNLVVSQDNTDDEAVVDGDDVTWTSSTITARAAVLYKVVGSAATDLLIAYVDFGEDKISSDGDYEIQWNSEGIINAG